MDTLVVALRVALSLGVVLALLWFVQRRLAKSTSGSARRSRRSAAVQVVARQGIGGKASVVVVDVEGERLVLGVTESQVAVLSSGAAPAAPAVLEAVVAPVADPSSAAVPAREAVRTPVVEPTVAPAPTAVVAAPADAFSAVLAAQDATQTSAADHRPRGTEPAPGLPAAPLRPRTRNRRSTHVAVPTQQQLQGSILSADTWRQAAAAVRSRRAG